ncbi:MAG: hypothetical protein U0805_06420 [Pirellulales bacterium]
MPAATKAKRQAAVATKAAKSKTAERTKQVEEHVSRNMQGRIIQETMTKYPSTIAQLVERTGFTEARVLDHVNYEIAKGRSKMKGKTVVVLAQPVRRNAS